jgi:hypothetical protein
VKILKRLLAIVAGLVLLAACFVYFWFQAQREPYTADAITRDLALQDDARAVTPQPRFQPEAINTPQPAVNKNLYWGELHLHTEQSFDSVLFGNNLTIADAYRFARGEPLLNAGGETMVLSEPLDFVAITDHAEGFGSRRHCGEAGLPLRQRVVCWLVSTPNLATFKYLRSLGANQESKLNRASSPGCALVGVQACLADAMADWADYQSLADAHNEPGVFTAFSAYEYSPPLPDSGKFHRNVIFRGQQLPALAVSALDAQTAVDLWQQLDKHCRGDCDYLTIAHNMNRTWGLAYARHTSQGDPYQREDWQLRARSEPLAEIYQIKGASECALGVGASDEECGFEQIFRPCAADQETGCAMPSSFARNGLKEGLLLAAETGLNPLRIGFIAATDSHNSNPGDTQEWDFRGAAALINSPAIRRQKHSERLHNSLLASRSPGGLAAIWAEENTRDALFAAMQRRETYGTSGTRIRLRFLAGWNIDQSLLTRVDPIADAYPAATPMGGVLKGSSESTSPGFFVWAEADPRSAPLQRLQMVKGWLEDGQARERVVDIVCADGLAPDADSGRCPDNGADVDLTNCSISADRGAEMLHTVWRDPDFNAEQAAFYYVRVLQNPTCRWSTYDALRLGLPLTPHAPPTIRERAWSSPIWYSAPTT